MKQDIKKPDLIIRGKVLFRLSAALFAAFLFLNSYGLAQNTQGNENLLRYFLENSMLSLSKGNQDSSQLFFDNAYELIKTGKDENLSSIFYLSASSILNMKYLYDSSAKDLERYLIIKFKKKDLKGFDEYYYNLASLYEKDYQLYKAKEKIDSVGLFTSKLDNALLLKKIMLRANIRLKLEMYDSARKDIKSAQKIIKDEKLKNEDLDCQLLLAKIDAKKGNYKAAIEAAKKILVLSQRDNYKRGIAEGYLLLGNLSNAVNEFSLSIDKFYKAGEIFRDINNPEGMADCSFGVGTALSNLNKADTAVINLLSAFKLYNSINCSNKEAITGELLGDLFIKADNGINARDYYDRSLKMYIRNNYLKGVASVYAKLGSLYSLFNLNDESVLMYNNSYKGYIMQNDSLNAAGVLLKAAEGLASCGQAKAAITYFEMAFDIYKKRKAWFDLGNGLMRLGDLYTQINDYDKAILKYGDANGHFNKIKNNLFIANIKFRMGETEFLRKKYPESRKLFLETISLFSKIGDMSLIPTCRLYLSLIELNTSEKPDIILKNLENNISEFKNLENYYGMGLAGYHIAKYYTGIKNYEKAFEFAKKGLEYAENSVYLKYQYFSKLGNYNLVQMLLRSLIASSFELNKKEESFYYANKLNDLNHIGSLQKMNFIPENNKNNIFREEYNNYQLKNNLIDLLNKEKDKKKISAIKEEIKKTDLKIDNIKKEISEIDPAYYELKYPRTSSKTELQKLISGKDIYLEYIVNDDALYSFAITQDNFLASMQKIKKTELLLDQSALLNGIIRFDSTDYFIHSSRKLYKILMEPFSSLLKEKEKVFIIPDKFLTYLPFDCLLTSDVNPDSIKALKMKIYKGLPYLILEHPVFFETSISNGLNSLKRNSSINPPDGFLSFKQPVYLYQQLLSQTDSSELINKQPPFIWYLYEAFKNDSIQTLPLLTASLEEAHAIVTKFEDKPIIEFTDLFATEDNFKRSGYLGKFKNIFLGTYAIINESQPHLSGIVFSEGVPDNREDGYLGMNELLNLKMNSDLTIMSRMLIGSTPGNEGEGFKTINRVFDYAGSKSVLYNLWDARGSAPMFYMLLFERINELKIPRAEAIRETKRDICTTREFPPFFWSSYILYGNP
jgi:CHAT domain-containing protein